MSVLACRLGRLSFRGGRCGTARRNPPRAAFGHPQHRWKSPQMERRGIVNPRRRTCWSPITDVTCVRRCGGCAKNPPRPLLHTSRQAGCEREPAVVAHASKRAGWEPEHVGWNPPAVDRLACQRIQPILAGNVPLSHCGEQSLTIWCHSLQRIIASAKQLSSTEEGVGR